MFLPTHMDSDIEYLPWPFSWISISTYPISNHRYIRFGDIVLYIDIFFSYICMYLVFSYYIIYHCQYANKINTILWYSNSIRLDAWLNQALFRFCWALYEYILLFGNRLSGVDIWQVICKCQSNDTNKIKLILIRGYLI